MILRRYAAPSLRCTGLCSRYTVARFGQTLGPSCASRAPSVEMRLSFACSERMSQTRRRDSCESTYPELLERAQVRNVLNLLYPVRANVQRRETLAALEALELRQAVVRNVQLLERLERREVLQLGDAVRLNRQHAKRLEILEPLRMA